MLAVTPAVLNETGEELGKEQGAQNSREESCAEIQQK